MTPDTLALKLRNDLAELERLYEAMDQFGRSHELSNEVLHAVQLALGELVSNVMRHGYSDHCEHQINIKVSVHQEEVQVEIEDDGCPFNLLERPPVNLDVPLEQRKPGGLGVHLVREMMDRVEYERRGDHNVVRVAKHFQ